MSSEHKPAEWSEGSQSGVTTALRPDTGTNGVATAPGALAPATLDAEPVMLAPQAMPAPAGPAATEGIPTPDGLPAPAPKPAETPKARDLGVMLDRLEVKYVVDRTRRTALERDIRALMRLDAHSQAHGGYTVRSLYFDTPDYMAYHEKVAGTAVRHKLRLRVYGDDPEHESPFVRLEIKSRIIGFIHKTTAVIALADYPELERAIWRRTLPPQRLMADPGVREFVRLQRQLNFEPKVIVQYRRQAFERPEHKRVRVSFDHEIVASRQLDLFGPLRGGQRILPYGTAVFEIKADGVLTRALHMMISKYDLGNEALSKYCYAVRATARLSARARADEDEL